MTYFGMYLLTIVDNLTTITGMFSVFLSMALVALIIITVVDRYESIGYACKSSRIKLKFLEKVRNKIAIAACLLTGISILVPSSKAIAFIFIAPQIIENGDVKDTFKNIPELTKLGTEYLKEILKEKIDDTQK